MNKEKDVRLYVYMRRRLSLSKHGESDGGAGVWVAKVL